MPAGAHGWPRVRHRAAFGGSPHAANGFRARATELPLRKRARAIGRYAEFRKHASAHWLSAAGACDKEARD